MLTSLRHRGFTLIELLVTLTVFSIMLALAMPSFTGMMQNSRLGTATKSYAQGLQTARAEAIRTNTPVDFVLTDSAITAGVETSAAPSATGKNWVVRSSTGGAFTLVEARAAQDGSGQAGIPSVTVAGVKTAPVAGAFSGVLTFNGFGGTATGDGIALTISNPAGGLCAPDGPMRCQQILVHPGGQVSVCDPQAPVADSRHCPT